MRYLDGTLAPAGSVASNCICLHADHAYFNVAQLRPSSALSESLIPLQNSP